MDASRFVGKTLREVKAEWPNVRVMRAGPVVFGGTADHRLDRLNVELDADNLKFSSQTRKIGDKEFTTQKVDGSMDDGIVVDASFG